MSAPAIERAVDALDVEKFWERGYAILPGVYTPEEIEAFRQAASETRSQAVDLLANPRLRSVLTDGRLVAVARKLLGTDDLIYSGDSSFTINNSAKGWHKDNADRIDPEAPDWDGRYTQLRFGIYCQDHSEHTGGLNLRVGSHDIPNNVDGECLYVKTKPGDLAVWSMRITHSGNGMLLKDPQAPYPLPAEQEQFDPSEVAEHDGDRIAVFAHIGANDKHAQRYADYTKTRTYLVSAWRKHPYTDDALAEAKAAGLTVRDMPREVMNDPTAGLSEAWQPFPYPGQAQPAPVSPPTAAPAVAPPPGPAPVSGPADSSRDYQAIAKTTLRRAYRAARAGAKGARDSWRASR